MGIRCVGTVVTDEVLGQADSARQPQAEQSQKDLVGVLRTDSGVHCDMQAAEVVGAVGHQGDR